MQKIKALEHKKIAILGLGVEGLSTAEFLTKHNLDLTLIEQKEEAEIETEKLQQLKKLGLTKFIWGKNALKKLTEFEVIFRSPGISPLNPDLKQAAEKGAQITSQTKLFFALCPCPIIGVTGTKGKGTTSSLIYEMLKKDKRDSYLGGNIGTPPLSFVDKLKPDSIVVLELSSFQLQDLSISPQIGVMLMVTSEHLDYHRDTSEYIEAKRNLLRFQKSSDFAVINRDYLASHESDLVTEAKVYQVSRERECIDGCFVRKNEIICRIGGKEEMVIKTQEVLLPGKHNLENICASIMTARLAGVSHEAIVSVLKSFKGLRHRLELVRVINGVSYYDDSFSTTPETAIAATQAFEAPEILILGGSPKGSDFSELGKVLSEAKNIKAIIGIGNEWEEIKSHICRPIEDILFIEGAGDMQTIVKAAAKIAQSGNVVLLSPACASFGMFKNYKDRGEQFKQAVKELK